MFVLTVFIIFAFQNTAVLLQYTSSDFKTNDSTEIPNFDLEATTTTEIYPHASSPFQNLDLNITPTDLPIKCVPNFDNFKVTVDKVSMNAYLTWDSNNTDACNYTYKVTTKAGNPESLVQSDYVTEQNYTVKNIKPCISYNFTVELQEQSDQKTLFALSDILETDIPEEDKVNNVTYVATTDSIFLKWVPSRNAKICKIKYRITVNITNSTQNIPYFRFESDPKHSVTSLSNCTYYNVTIRSSGLREGAEKDRDPLMYVISTLPEHVNDLNLSVSGNYSKVTWNPPSNRECLKGYNISTIDFNATTLETHFETNQSLFCTPIVIYPISKDDHVGKSVTILKPGLVQNVQSYITSDSSTIYWDPPKNKTCVGGYLVEVTNHSKNYTNENTTTFTIDGLTACTRYEIKLYAVTKRNELGDPYIMYGNTSTPNDVGPVENFNKKVDDKIVTLSWNPPSNAKACKLQYLVEVYDEHNQIFRYNRTSDTTQMFNFTGAVYCSQYTMSVKTVTHSAESDPNQLFVEIPEVRTAPTCTPGNVLATHAVLECKFEDFTKNVCPMERLTVTCNNITKTVPNLSNRTKIEVTFNDLHAYSQYECTALSITASGESPLSKPVVFRTEQGVPDSPQVDEIGSYTNTSFRITWKEVENIRGVFKNYHLHVESFGATYFIPSECQRNETTTFDLDESSISDTTFLFAQAFPSYKYEVTIKVATEAGYGSPSNKRYVFTKGGIPEEPRNTNLSLSNFTRGKDYNVSAVIIWDYPCFTNGNVSHFQIEIVGKSYVGDQIPDHLVEEKVPVNGSFTDLKYEYTLENLKPAFEYNISIKVVTKENLESTPEKLKFNSFESFPEAPSIKPISEVTKNTFTIEWDKPKQKRGSLREYVLHVVNDGPRYWIPGDCEVSKKNDTSEVPGNRNNFTYKKARPCYAYNVTVTAVNKIGSSPPSEKLVTRTSEAEPEEVRNLEVTLEDLQTEEYSAKVKITLDHPCHTYGTIKGISVILTDQENNYQNKSYINEVSERYEKTFSDLLPEHGYRVSVQVHTKTHESKGITHDFKTTAGIPPLLDKIIPPVPQDSGTATFVLVKDLFNNRNGKILYYAIILGENGNNEKSMFGKLRETNEWPELAENVTEKDKMKPYQITPEYWNPFEGNDLTNITIILGDNSFDGNKPLSPSITYTFKVRGFTKNGYRDSPTATFKIPSETNLGLILGLTFGIMGTCAIFFLIFVIWKKRQNWNKKKDSIKSIPIVPIPISILNFSKYYSDLQDNGEKLKLEFSLLASKSSEIVANFSDATLPENKKKNRYTNILPYDESRVKLLPENEEEEPEGDYINASYVKGYSGNVEYIATQGPLEHTVMDFWKMVIQENSSLIVMVAQFVEQNKDKCYKYFPNVHENMNLENGVSIRCCTELSFKNYVVRTFMVQTETQQWTSTHLQFTDWPDFGCPTGTEVIIEFCQLMRHHAGRNQDPIIIHCSAGVGRTGTLIALDILLQAISCKSDIDIFGTVLNLRRDRKNMVQTEKQYLFIHNCIDDVLQNPTCISTKDDMFSKEPIYENLNGIKNGFDNHTQESKF